LDEVAYLPIDQRGAETQLLKIYTFSRQKRATSLSDFQTGEFTGFSRRRAHNFRVIARNVFYAALGPFKKAYNNYRDDHDQFRQLTQSA
jgi:hypothetical protein